MSKDTVGSSFDDFLRKEDIYEEVVEAATARVESPADPFAVGSKWKHKKGDIYVTKGYPTLKIGTGRDHVELDGQKIVIYFPADPERRAEGDYGRALDDFSASFKQIVPL